MDMHKIGIKNLIGLLAIAGGLAYWGVSTYLGSRPQWWNLEGKDPCQEIRKANDRIGLLTVNEIVTKDVIYLKQDASKFKSVLKNVGKFYGWVVCPIGMMTAAHFVDPSLINYEMDSGLGIVWGHQGVIEYVVDLSQAEVNLESNESRQERPRIKVTVPAPYVDPESVRLNLEAFGPLLKSKAFIDGDKTIGKMEQIAKTGFVMGLKEIADTEGYLQDARVSATAALSAIYASIADGAEVEVQFEESK